MARSRGFVLTVLGFCAPLVLGAQQPGSVTAPAPPKASTSPAPPPIGLPLDRIVAIVGQRPILWSEVEEAINYLQGRGDQIPGDTAGFRLYALDKLNDMIDQEVLVSVAKQYKAEVDEKDVTPDVDKLMKDLHARFKSDAEFRAALKSDGFGTETEFRNSQLERKRRDLLQQMAMDSLRAHGRLAAPANVTEAEITDAFDKQKDKMPKRLATISFKQIVVEPKPNPQERTAALAKADSLLIVIQKGGDFETIAKKESQDPTTKDDGGALPWVRRGLMVEAFDRAIFSGLPPGSVIPVPIETSFGFHIIRIDRVQPAQVKSSHILIIPKLDSADVARAQLAADTVIQKWRSGTPYDTIVKYYHDPAEEKSEPEGYPVDSLPLEYRDALADVRKGQLSRPFPIPNVRTGMPKFVVVLVTDRVEGGDYTVADLRDKIRQQLTQERQIRRALDGLRKEQFVRIMM
jgi:peptidyl-prolyl cis-trans isomerase SurA